MSVAPFDPKFMKVGILTAALQELTPRAIRDADPDRAIEDWAAFARQIGADCVQLSAAFHPSEADVPPEAMLDPVANTLDLRQALRQGAGGTGAERPSTPTASVSPTSATSTTSSTTIRRSGRRSTTSCSAPWTRPPSSVPRPCAVSSDGTRRSPWTRTSTTSARASFPSCVRRRAAACSTASSSAPCPAGPPATTSTTTSPTPPGTWIALHRIAEKAGVGDAFRIHYDPSHAILMGQDTRSIFQFLKDEGYAFLVAGFHVKGQVIDARGVSAWGYGGQTVERGDWKDGAPSRTRRTS